LVGRVNTEIPTSYNLLLFVRPGWVSWALPTSYRNRLSAMPSCEAQRLVGFARKNSRTGPSALGVSGPNRFSDSFSSPRSSLSPCPVEHGAAAPGRRPAHEDAGGSPTPPQKRPDGRDPAARPNASFSRRQGRYTRRLRTRPPRAAMTSSSSATEANHRRHPAPRLPPPRNAA
jgi:hypothetical protein